VSGWPQISSTLVASASTNAVFSFSARALTPLMSEYDRVDVDVDDA
jgi:hypothetical protein